MSSEVRRTIELSIDSVKDMDVSVVDYKNLDFDMEFVFDKFIKGDKGDPPTRGVDYWTDKDILEFKDYCVNVITQQWFGTEAQYEYMYKHGQIQPDWIYFICEDDNTEQSVIVNGNTITITRSRLSEDQETLTLKGSINGESLVLKGIIDNELEFSIDGDDLVSSGVLLSVDRQTISLRGTINGETLILTNI